MNRLFIATALVLVSIVAGEARAQAQPEALFSQLEAAAASSALRNAPARVDAVIDRQVVGMRLDRLFETTAGRVLLNVNGHNWVARFEHLDRDVQGHRAWVGSIDGIEYSHVSFAERNGIVSGLIDALSETYQLRTVTAGTYLLERVQAVRGNSELEPLLDTALPDPPRNSPAAVTAADDPSTIDILLLYTPNARVRQGGAPQIQALAAQIISDSNAIFTRSGVAPRLRLVGSQEYAFTETPSMGGDLTQLSTTAAVRALRDQFGADLVQFLEAGIDPTACGVGYLLTSLSTVNFNAYSVADIACAFQYTPTHEMGHTMGSHHAPEDGASGALFPYSYGYKDPVRAFRTVMAYQCAGVNCTRIPYMSNPAVPYNGATTGTPTQNNALSINNAASTVANFRQATTTPPPGTTPPGPATGLGSTVTGNSVTLRWNAVTADVAWTPSAATSYTLQVGGAPGASNLFLQSVGNTTTVTGAAPAGTYYWRVVALNAAGPGPASAEATFTIGAACTVPAAVPSLSSAVVGRVVTLTWSVPPAGTTPFTYRLEAGSAAGLANLYNASVGNETAITVAAPPGTYFVRVRAQNSCGTGPVSIERLITVP